MISQSLRQQHSEILVHIKEIDSIMRTEKVNGGTKIRDRLVALAGKLNVHLAVEDKNLYPKLLQSNNAGLVNVARRFMAEMGTIGGEFKKFMTTWKDGQTISSTYTEFEKEYKNLISVLAKRVNSEENELYKIADESGI